jgi:hypothetical protein
MKPRILRLQWPTVQPIELWDALVEQKRLCDATDDSDLAYRLGALLERLQCETVQCASGNKVGPLKFDSVVLCGGRAEVIFPLISAVVPNTYFAPTPIASGVRGGLAALVEKAATGNHFAIDVGQSFVKISDGETLVLTERAPIVGRERRVGAMTELVAHAMRDFTRNRAVEQSSFAIALCCEIRADLSLVRNTYGDPPATMQSLAEAIDSVGYRGAPLYVANDAELAARDPLRPQSARVPTLMLTLGSGVGAALVDRDPSE